LPQFNLEDYTPVDERIHQFWKDHPEGRILTDLVHFSESSYIVKASVWAHGQRPDPDTTGYAQEDPTQGYINKTSALENCETSAIGRALANMGYATKGNRPSREEMQKVTRHSPTPCTHPEWEPVPGREGAERCKTCGVGRRRK
jgi:hypothetical protein